MCRAGLCLWSVQARVGLPVGDSGRGCVRWPHVRQALSRRAAGPRLPAAAWHSCARACFVCAREVARTWTLHHQQGSIAANSVQCVCRCVCVSLFSSVETHGRARAETCAVAWSGSLPTARIAMTRCDGSFWLQKEPQRGSMMVNASALLDRTLCSKRGRMPGRHSRPIARPASSCAMTDRQARAARTRHSGFRCNR